MDFLVRLLRQVKGASAAAEPRQAPPSVEPQPFCKTSPAWQQLVHRWSPQDALSVLDLGCTSSSNFRFFLDRGCHLQHLDLLHELSLDSGDAGQPLTPATILADNLSLPMGSLDAILLWDVLDYVPREFIRPLVDQLSLSLRPGGALLALFHSREAGVNPVSYQFHIQDHETIEWRPRPARPILHFFHVRHIENLFSTFHSIRFFLGHEGTREVLMVR